MGRSEKCSGEAADAFFLWPTTQMSTAAVERRPRRMVDERSSIHFLTSSKANERCKNCST
jgi:hypothetical protein